MAHKTVYLTADILREIAHRLAVNFFEEYNEPMPDFSRHDQQLLDSALSLPRATYGRKELYEDLPTKASVMFYSLIKNHPFPNGNKRMATASLLVFLYLNGQWLQSEQKAIYRWAVKMAKSKTKDRTVLVSKMGKWLKKSIEKNRRLKRRRQNSQNLFFKIRSVLVWLVPLYWHRKKKK